MFAAMSRDADTPRDRGRPSLLRLVLGWGGWLVPLYAVWLMYVGVDAWLELVAGACAVAVAATAQQAVRRTGFRGERVDLRTLALALRLPYRVGEEFAILMWALVSAAVRRERPHGGFRRLKAGAAGEGAEAVGRRAAITILGGVAPNTYVVDIDPETDAMLVHDLHREHARGRWLL